MNIFSKIIKRKVVVQVNRIYEDDILVLIGKYTTLNKIEEVYAIGSENVAFEVRLSENDWFFLFNDVNKSNFRVCIELGGLIKIERIKKEKG